MKRRLYRVVEAHRASFAYSMIASVGDQVNVGREDPEMQGWFWCRDGRGVEMWVPKTHINVSGESAVFNQPYNSVEVNAAIGDVIQRIGEALGWMECLDAEWRYGWIPATKVEELFPKDPCGDA